jgi:hypothetical protein
MLENAFHFSIFIVNKKNIKNIKNLNGLLSNGKVNFDTSQSAHKK